MSPVVPQDRVADVRPALLDQGVVSREQLQQAQAQAQGGYADPAGGTPGASTTDAGDDVIDGSFEEL